MSLSSQVARGKTRRIAKSTGQNRDFPLRRSKRSRELSLRTTALLRMIVTRHSTGKTTRTEPMSPRAYNRKTTPLPKFLVRSNTMPSTGLISRATGLTTTWLLWRQSITPGFSLTSITTPSVPPQTRRMLPTTLLTGRYSSRIIQLRTFMNHNTTSTCSNITLQRLMRLSRRRSRLQWSKRRKPLPRSKR